MKKRLNQPQIFYCEKCDYSTYNNSDFKKHTTTRKHILGGNNEGKAMLGKENMVNSTNYSCSCCRFITINKTNYEDHLLTKKHQKNSIGEIMLPDYKCSQCNKEYMNYNALWKHKKKCVITDENAPEMNSNPDK